MSQVISFADYTPPARFDSIPWETVNVEESYSPEGPWTLIDTLTLDPVDADPSDPQSRNLTTANASDDPDLWYRLTFVDGNEDLSQPTSAIQNTADAVQFATSDEFADRFGVTLTDDERDRVNALLAKASGLIQDYTKQTITLVTDDEMTVRGSYDQRLPLPQRPVVEVTSVFATLLDNDPVELDPTSWYLDADMLVRASVLASVEFFGTRGRGWLSPRWELAVTYTHGYEEIPDLVKNICMEVAVRVWVNPGSVVQETIGDTATSYAAFSQPPRGLMLTDSEKRELKRFLRIGVGTVTLR